MKKLAFMAVTGRYGNPGKLKGTFLALVPFFAFALRGFSAEIHIAPTGDDLNPGTGRIPKSLSIATGNPPEIFQANSWRFPLPAEKSSPWPPKATPWLNKW